MGKRTLILILVVLSSGLALVRASYGKEYSTKAVEIVCPYTPGSPMDIGARLFADMAAKYLGQPIVVLNKPGAGGSIGASDVINSKPDGYKLIILTNFFFATTVKTQKIPFDPNYLIPLANFMEYKLGIAIRGDSAWKTLKDMVDYARQNPGALRWGHGGRGTTMHMGPLLIFKKAGVQTIDVPYKGIPEEIAALLGNHLDAASMVYGGAKDQVKAGKLRYVVFCSDRRYSDPSDVPSATELGYPEVAKLTNFVGLYAHKDTPEEIKNHLIDAFRKTCEDPEFKKGIESFGEVPRFGGPEFMKEAIKRGEEVGIPIIKELGLYVRQ